ncbi:hypothetical protein LMJF_32_3100 [Leishmania major strain Friedlin]|uniref:Uncharacterized protein n=1 Tax=Leishmania major TaxID=5664 RepID=Q4Q4W1_LEIMA|nr:hypothetical protein LMJF_32_3100 [Leishmania major strain Friedlin]CAG9580454.1 hypothetical_protein_-_conserved [Leishmania major strain Friedlin]CAJ08842.1 hypothetical protein LMJF_32_3100 [Leishmania major strain Friedlin]|eukprot:XP_001685637.1 hypothetical protein LMJF_32_3100 [Leishmania major strain Friedlin]
MPADSTATAREVPIDTVALQLDAEMAQMRLQRQRYSTLCTRKNRLQAHVDELNAQGKDLTFQRQREQTRSAQELEHGLASSSTSLPEISRTPGDQAQLPAEVLGGALQELTACITERRELLQHLRDGSHDCLKLRDARFAKCSLSTVAGLDDHVASQSGIHASDTTAVIAGRGEAPTRCAARNPVSDSAVTSAAPASGLRHVEEGLAKAHQALCRGEEKALAEREYLLLLLQQCAQPQQLQQGRGRLACRQMAD